MATEPRKAYQAPIETLDHQIKKKKKKRHFGALFWADSLSLFLFKFSLKHIEKLLNHLFSQQLRGCLEQGRDSHDASQEGKDVSRKMQAQIGQCLVDYEVSFLSFT